MGDAFTRDAVRVFAKRHGVRLGACPAIAPRRPTGLKPYQQRLFPDPQPIVDRLGREFFLTLPNSPGVYRMHDASGQVIYVGKAKNLRRRLCSYRVANPERMARRTLRLLRLVARIEWESCADESSALQREAELLLEIKPRFNRAGVWRGPRRSVAWRCEASGFCLRIVDAVEEGWGSIGPYGAYVRRLHRVLVRRVWCHLNAKRGVAGMPAGWTRGLHGPDVTLRVTDVAESFAVQRLVELSLHGHVEALAQWNCSSEHPFERSWWEEDLEFFKEHSRFAEGVGVALSLARTP